ncbi:unnamed protein product [Closterium sp. NIES-65]|nr:unnamed protein product [Closterium sp. NIES-65]
MKYISQRVRHCTAHPPLLVLVQLRIPGHNLPRLKGIMQEEGSGEECSSSPRATRSATTLPTNPHQDHDECRAPRLRSSSRGKDQAPANAAGQGAVRMAGRQRISKTRQLGDEQGNTSRAKQRGDDNAGDSSIQTGPRGAENQAQGDAGEEAHQEAEQEEGVRGEQAEPMESHLSEAGMNTRTEQRELPPTRAVRDGEEEVVVASAVTRPAQVQGTKQGPDQQQAGQEAAETAKARGHRATAAATEPTPGPTAADASEEPEAQTAPQPPMEPTGRTRIRPTSEEAATAGTAWPEHGAKAEVVPGQSAAGEGDGGGKKTGRAHGETDECARHGSGTQAPSAVRACLAMQKARCQHPRSSSPRRLGTGLAPACPGLLVGWAQQEVPPPQSHHVEAAGAGPSSGAVDEAGRPHVRAERVEAEAEDAAAAVEEEQVTTIDKRRGGTPRQRLLRERAAEVAAGNAPAGTRGQAPGRRGDAAKEARAEEQGEEASRQPWLGKRPDLGLGGKGTGGRKDSRGRSNE